MISDGDTVYRNKERCNMSRKRQRNTDFVGKLIHASIVDRYDPETLGNLLATTQSKSYYLNIHKVQD